MLLGGVCVSLCFVPDEVVAYSLPGPSNHLKKFRMPFTTLSKKNVATDETFHAIFEVFRWSLEVLLGDVWPLTRHDGTAHTDAASKRKAGQSLGLRGLLAEIRCDWAALKEIFNFPAWSEKKFCWQCDVSRDTYKETGLDAGWRRTMLDHWGFLTSMLGHGGQAEPPFGLPHVQRFPF